MLVYHAAASRTNHFDEMHFKNVSLVLSLCALCVCVLVFDANVVLYVSVKERCFGRAGE